MSRLPSSKRAVFLRALQHMGATTEAARGGGSGVRILYAGRFSMLHVHPSKEVGSAIAARTLKDLGIDPDEFRKHL